MAAGAYLLGSVPNVRFYANLFNLVVARDWHYRDAGVLDHTYFRFFTFRSLQRALTDAGFSVCRLEGLNQGGRGGWSARTIADRSFRRLLLMASLGGARDIKYLQIGFLAKMAD